MDKFKIVVGSGKGGVGKSMISSSLAIFLSREHRVLALDSDVDAPNLDIWLGQKGKWKSKTKLKLSSLPVINYNKCDGCGECVKHCQFGAMKMKNGKPKVNNFICEGCGVCKEVCPKNAITMKKVENAYIKEKVTQFDFPLITGQLIPGFTGSGKIVEEIKKQGNKKDWDFMIIDSAPGTGCPVNAALRNTDFVVLVVEPTPSGFEDIKNTLEVVNHFSLKYGVVINKWDLNKKLTRKIEKFFKNRVLGKISYNKEIFKKVSQFQPILKTNLNTKKELIKIFKNLKNRIER